MRNNKMELTLAMADFNNTTEMVEMDEWIVEEAQYIWEQAKALVIEAGKDIVDACVNHRIDLATKEEQEWMRFYEYASHKNEPNFDWDFYSDWHKDLYGVRPRW